MKLRCVRPHSTRVCVLTVYASCIPTNHLIPDASGQAAASAARTGAFDNISRLYEADREDEDTPISFPSTIKITLCELFDFSSAFWASYQRRTSVPSLEEELEIWDLLDMDADGEAETGGPPEGALQDDLLAATLGI